MSAGDRPGLGLLRPHLVRSRRRLVVAVVAVVVKDSPLWVIPVITAVVVDLLVADASPGSLLLPAAAVVAMVAVNVGANAVYVRAHSATVRQLGVDLRGELAGRLQTLSISYHRRAGSAVLQTKVVRDVENLELMLQQALGPVATAVSVLVGASVTIAVRVPVFLGVFALAVPLAVLLVRWLRARTAEANEGLRREVELLSTGVGEMASLMPITRAHGLEHVALDRVRGDAERVRSVGLRLDRLNGRFGAISWASFQLLSMSCLFGAATLSLTGVTPVSAGDVVLLSSYFGLLTGTLVGAFQLAPLVTRGLESAASIQEVLRAEDDPADRSQGRPVARPRGAVHFEDVSYRYDRDLVVDRLTLRVDPGQTVALVGRSGSGKTTVLDLALGLLRPSSGRVLLDGQDLTELDLRSYRQHVAVVPQEPVLFAGSIRDNVAHGLPDATDDQLWAALEDADAATFVRALPHGWSTMVDERGAGLSGGQRQRLAVARALVRDPRLLLLDEATSALDPASEHALHQALERLRRGRTTLVVAHRLSTVRSADRIVVLDAGRVVETGTHVELSATDGPYRRLLDLADA